MCIASMSDTLRTHTLTLTDEQAKYLARVVIADVHDNSQIARSRQFESYGPVESARIRKDIEIGCGLIGLMRPEIPEGRKS